MIHVSCSGVFTDVIFNVVQSWCKRDGHRGRRRKSDAFSSFAFGFIERTGLSTRTILVALAYVDRLYSEATLNAESGFEQALLDLLISSVIVAHKVCDLNAMPVALVFILVSFST